MIVQTNRKKKKEERRTASEQRVWLSNGRRGEYLRESGGKQKRDAQYTTNLDRHKRENSKVEIANQ